MADSAAAAVDPLEAPYTGPRTPEGRPLLTVTNPSWNPRSNVPQAPVVAPESTNTLAPPARAVDPGWSTLQGDYAPQALPQQPEKSPATLLQTVPSPAAAPTVNDWSELGGHY